MSRKNFYHLTIILSILALALAGCGSAPDGGANENGESGDVRITIGTGGNSGTYYPLGTAMAQKIFSNVEGVSQARGVTTGASVANIQELAQGKYQMAFVQNDIAYFAAHGETVSDFDGKPVENIAGMATLYPEDIQVVTRKDSGLESLEDLKGKKVAVGDQGSGAEANAKQVLEAAGITYDDVEVNYLGFGDAAQGLQNGTLDAAFITAGAPTSAIQELGATQKVHVLSIPDDVIKELTEKYPYYTEQTISADTYKDQGQEEEIKTVSVMAMLIVDNELSEDLVYNLTKAMFEGKEALEAAHARGADITLESALDGMSIDLHPGAKKYFDEQGISTE
ncbi:TAXI family TRAP transporter solute-binding subunit [Desmospora activa]|uniref:TRAP transporter TAXI family solute receptor n=1 Tax=Desmospora activa DSM 45169 TaxID=1121389 RepID=A0A2T4Z9S0_9BACL|nr:TAXI family TRAP transporter solute-binding subunit [Desmospora activa]PTM58623.1 hypothetical protein C8J48_1208 [Desmospora activa DSM 45169]